MRRAMRGMSLFTGSGIGDYAAEQCGIETVVQCENDPACLYCLERLFPDAIRFKDVHDVSAKSLWERGVSDIDIISGGFPCQDLSCAGKGTGIEGSRSGLWREMFRVIRQVRPRWLLIENVPALRLRGSDRVIAPLERIGYTVWPLVVGAWSVGAPHKRDRVWIVGKHMGDTASIRRDGLQAVGGEAVGGEAVGRLPKSEGGGSRLVDSKTKRRSPKGSRWNGRKQGANPTTTAMADAEHPESRPGTGQEPQAEQRRDRPAIDGIGGKLEIATGERLEGRSDGKPRQYATTSGLFSTGSGERWPARPGEPQHPWEAPRLIEQSLGGEFDGFPDRVQRRANKAALRVLGNAWCYQNAIIIYQWITAECEGR